MLGHDIAAEGRRSGRAVGYLPEHDCLPPDVSASDFVVHLAMMSGLPRGGRPRARRRGAAPRRARRGAVPPDGRLLHRHEAEGQARPGPRARPRLVLLDEPTNGLDPAGRDEMLGLVQRIGHDFGISVMVTSHLLGELERVSDHVVVLDGGRLLRAPGPRVPRRHLTTLLVEVLGDDAQHRMQHALAAAGVTATARGAAAHRRPGRGPTTCTT